MTDVHPFTKIQLLRPRPLVRHAWDLVGLPFRLVLFPDAWNKRCGWSSLEEERLRAVLPQVEGRLLDVGCGTNSLVRCHGGGGTGVDVHDFGGGALILPDTRQMPFDDASFDTVTFLACLNHIPYRLDALREVYRVLRPGGRVVATMISRLLGNIGHAIWWYSEDKRRETAEGETGGLNPSEVVGLLETAGFRDVRQRRFCYGLNRLYLAVKPAPARSAPKAA